MTQAILKPVTFDEFIDWYPENSENRYELHKGAILEMPKATGEHSEVAGFLVAEINFEVRRLGLPTSFPRNALSKLITSALVTNRMRSFWTDKGRTANQDGKRNLSLQWVVLSG